MIKKMILWCWWLLLSLVAVSQQKITRGRIAPDYVKLQFAGSIGFLAAGFGYTSPNKKWEGDFYYGYVPASVGGVTIHSLSTKITLKPFSRKLKGDWTVDFLRIGLLINYAFGKQYFLFSPSYYAYSYYGFPTRIHAGIFAGEAVGKGRLGVYYEVGATAKDILSYVKNAKSLTIIDIAHLGIGISYRLH